MKYLQQSENLHLISLNTDEIQIMSKILCEVCRAIPPRSFSIRMLYSLDGVKLFILYLQDVERLSLLDQKAPQIEISKEMFYMIWQGFNEVCNGLRIKNFIEIFGVSALTIEDMFTKWIDFRDLIDI
jgi:hypothetical protein